MEVVQDTMSCAMTHERRHLIDPRPAYQRGPVWTLQQRQRLIDSILRRYDIPKLYLTKRTAPTDDDPYEHEVTDGQQRLLAIWGYLEGAYPLGDDSNEIPDFGDLRGLSIDELPPRARDRVKLFKLSIGEIRDASEAEVRELFLRLQEGASLNPAEKRNAMLGDLRDFIADLGEHHPVFPLTRLSSNRFKWHDLAALVTRLELAGGPADLKASDLKDMYEQNTSFDHQGAVAGRIRDTLDYLAEVLRTRPDEMRIKWGFVDLYLAVSELLHRQPAVEIRGREEDVRLMFEAFERQRLLVEDPADLIAEAADKPELLDMYRYIEAFTTEGATKSSVATRHAVYLRRLAVQIPDQRIPTSNSV